jgi:hypothetical protein
MNAEANAASENWEKLLSKIREHSRFGVTNVKLSDSEADLYHFADEIYMRRMRARVVETLQTVTSTHPSGYLTFGSKFFMTMNEQQQQSFFHSIFNLPAFGIYVGEVTDEGTESPESTISTPALLETLPQVNTSVYFLSVSNFALTCQSDVKALSNIILAKGETILSLALESIECPVDGCNKEDTDEPNGFLDPLLYATSDLRAFSVSTKTRSVHFAQVSPTALRALFVEGKRFDTLSLRGLGLTDSHVLAIVDGLSTPGTRLSYLNLESNPDISAQGNRALLNLINRTNVYGGRYGHQWIRFCVDDKAWEYKLNLVSEMNTEFCRWEYLTNGTFTSEERKWQWVERVASLPSSDEEIKRSDARLLNFIWYTLCQNPEMMQT